MTFDSTFTNGVIAVREKQLLGEKVLRFPEMGTGEILRVLSESGFGGGESDLEAIFAHEEQSLDTFIRTYAPCEADKAFFLAPRDFHNLKALYKAEKLGIPADGMLAPQGMWSVEVLKERLESKEGIPEIPEEASGAEIGAAFDKAELSYLLRASKLRPVLTKLLKVRADMTDILTCFRAGTREEAEPLLLGCGTLKKRDFDRIFSDDPDVRAHAFDKSPYHAFYAACLAAAEKKTPFTEAERIKESYGERYFFERRFELQGKEPFLYYVFRRRAEIKDVRTVLICLNAGVDAREIKRRLIGGM